MTNPVSTPPFVGNTFTPSQPSPPVAAGTDEKWASDLVLVRQRIAEAIGNESDASAVMADVDETLASIQSLNPKDFTVDQLVQITLVLAAKQARLDLGQRGVDETAQVIYDLGRMASAAPGGDGRTWGPKDLETIKADFFKPARRP